MVFFLSLSTVGTEGSPDLTLPLSGAHDTTRPPLQVALHVGPVSPLARSGRGEVRARGTEGLARPLTTGGRPRLTDTEGFGVVADDGPFPGLSPGLCRRRWSPSVLVQGHQGPDTPLGRNTGFLPRVVFFYIKFLS